MHRFELRSCVIGAALALGVGVGGACAQTLELGVPSGLGPGEGVALNALVGQLEAKQERVPSEDAPATDRVRFELRRLALDLLQQGERDGDAGAVRVLTGWALAHRIDAWLAGWPADLRAQVSLELGLAWLRSRSDPPLGDGALDRWLRDGLAPLTGFAAHTGGGGDAIGAASTGWVRARVEDDRVIDLDAVIARLNASVHASASLRDTLVELGELLVAARSNAAYRPSGQKVERMLADAARAVQVGGVDGARADRRAWIPDSVTLRLASDLDDALSDLLTPDRSRDAQDQLARLALIARIVVAMDDAEAVTEIQVVQRALVGMIETTSRDPGYALPLLGGVALACEALGDRDALRYEPVVASPVAVGWRRLISGHRVSESRLRREILRTIERSGPGGSGGDVSPMSDPSFLVGLRAHRRSVGQFENFMLLSEHLTGVDPRVTFALRGARPRVLPEREELARRLLAYGNRLDDDNADVADGAFASLMLMAEELALATDMPGERELRAAIADAVDVDLWSRVTGGRHVGLAEAIDRARERWGQAWAMPMTASVTNPPPTGDVGEAAADVARLRRVLRLAFDGVVLTRAVGGAGDGETRSEGFAANAWAGWELSSSTARMAAVPMLERLPGLVAVAGGRGAVRGVEQRLEAFEREHRLAILLARIEHGVRARGLTPQLLTGAAAGFEFGSGAPDPVPGRAWLAEHRRELATLCRAAEELAHARRTRDRGRESRLGELVDDRAGFVLEVSNQ